MQIDVTDDEGVVAAAADVEQRFGRLDVLVNNAGISGPFDPATWTQDPTTLDLDVVRQVVDVNVYGVVRVTNAFLPLLRRSPAPRIVNASSSMGSLGRQPGPIMAAYAPSKTFLNRHHDPVRPGLRGHTDHRERGGAPVSSRRTSTASRATGTAAQGAATAIRLATLPDDGPRGGFFEDAGVVPW